MVSQLFLVQKAMLYRRLENATCLFLLAKSVRPLLGMQCHPQCLNYTQGTGLSLFLPSFLGRFWPIFQINRHNAIHTPQPRRSAIACRTLMFLRCRWTCYETQGCEKLIFVANIRMAWGILSGTDHEYSFPQPDNTPDELVIIMLGCLKHVADSPPCYRERH